MERSLPDIIGEQWAFFRAWLFEQRYRFRLVRRTNPAPCPCCGYLTFSADDLGNYEICAVCFWEDEGYPATLDQIGIVVGGANRSSLKVARENFMCFGACDREIQKHTRQPYSFEIPEGGPDPHAYFPLAKKLWDSR